MAQSRKTSLVGIGPNGAIIRLTASFTCVRRVVTFAGQTGPPTVLQLGSVEPIQLASTDASRAPSRAACERVLLKKTKRPISKSPSSRSRKTGRTRANSTRDCPRAPTLHDNHFQIVVEEPAELVTVSRASWFPPVG